MPSIFFISDLHLGHKKILDFAGQYRKGDCPAEHDQILIENWNSVINKRDTVYVLGDVYFGGDEYGHMCLEELKGIKKLIMGNHDTNYRNYVRHFRSLNGFRNLGGYWLSHAPIHPMELRGLPNIHGHLHHTVITDHYGDPDPRYINVCVEQTGGFPVPFDDIKSGSYKSRII